MVVSLSTPTADPSGDVRYRSASPWWLELSLDGERIVAAGPLIDPSNDPDGALEVRRRYPRVEARDGRILLSYTVFRPDETEPEPEPRVGDLVRHPIDGRLSLRFGAASPKATGWFLIDPAGVSKEIRWTIGWSRRLGLTGVPPFASIPELFP